MKYFPSRPALNEFINFQVYNLLFLRGRVHIMPFRKVKRKRDQKYGHVFAVAFTTIRQKARSVFPNEYFSTNVKIILLQRFNLFENYIS